MMLIVFYFLLTSQSTFLVIYIFDISFKLLGAWDNLFIFLFATVWLKLLHRVL